MNSRLYRAARRFDKTPCKDAYTGFLSFYGQLLAWDKSTRDSESAQRRVISAAPETVRPPRGVVSVGSEVYILGKPHTDTFQGEALRVGFPSVLADGLMTVRTLEQVCKGQPGYQTYASKAWVKNDAFTEQSSHLNPKHHVHYSADENIGQDLVLSLSGINMVVRTVVAGTSGVMVATADQMQSDAIQAATVASRVYDPVTEDTTQTTVSTTVVRMRWQSLFSYGSDAAPTFNPGDIQIAIDKSVATVKPGHLVTMADGDWLIDSVVSLSGIWLCKAKRES